MAKILYGVAGEGFGHSSRSELTGQHLIEAGHDVMFAASRKSLNYLKPTFNGRVQEVFGLSFCYQDGRIRPVRTVLQNLSGYRKGILTNHRLFSKTVKEFKPDLVITDFDPFSAWWAWRNHVPCVSINHEHLLTCCRYETEGGSWKQKAMAEIVMRGYHTFADAYVVINFFKAPLINKAAQLVPPVVRKTVLQFPRSDGDHILMYCTDSGDTMRDRIYNIVSQCTDHRFFIYGFNIETQKGNCTFKQTSTNNFLKDLAACRAVVATAGFSLLSECLHFRKPMLLMPVHDQFEQFVNACHIKKLGMGVWTRSLTLDDLRGFLERLETFRFDHPQVLLPDNNAYFKKVDDTFTRLGFNLGISTPNGNGSAGQSTVSLFDKPLAATGYPNCIA